MRQVNTIADLRAIVGDWSRAGHRIGFVPTMGALHDGHLSLVAAARAECDRTIASIFVNPTQFGPGEDLDRYPRQEQADATALERAGCDLLYLPDAREIYPDGSATQVRVTGLDSVMCGAARPGHFDGVATVVTKLLNQVQPDAAFFGEKDWQQLAIIRRLVVDLDLLIDIHGVATMREADGLAMSSRNQYLSPADRQVAPNLSRLLRETAEKLAEGHTAAAVLASARQELEALGFQPEYLDLRDEASLDPADRANDRTRLFVAARLGDTRLIDNWPSPGAREHAD